MIKTIEESIIAKELIQEIDKLINQCYNNLKGLNSDFNFKEIVEYEDFIQRLKIKRLGYYNLIVIFNAENDNNKEIKKDTVIVTEDMTLVDISNAFFGQPEYAHLIYVENDLDTSLLEVGQEIKIPILENTEKVVLQSKVIVSDICNILYKKNGITLYE